MKKIIEKFWTNLAWLMPRQLVYWCVVRAFAHATTGKFGDTIASELTLFDCASRWNEKREESIASINS